MKTIKDDAMNDDLSLPYEERPTSELPVWNDAYLDEVEDKTEADLEEDDALPVELAAMFAPSALLDQTAIHAVSEPLHPTVGRIVRYVLPGGEERPALVVRVWNNTPDPMMCNLVVFTDGENDAPVVPERVNAHVPLLLWRTSVHYSEQAVPGFWRWPYNLSFSR